MATASTTSVVRPAGFDAVAAAKPLHPVFVSNIATLEQGNTNWSVYDPDDNANATGATPPSGWDFIFGTLWRIGTAPIRNAEYEASQEVVISYRLRGSKGDDSILGKAANEDIRGGDGKDRLHGNNGHDDLFGEAGADSLFGGAGRDELFGGEGFDTLYGGADNDALSGDAGNDTLRGEAGDDALSGGTGNDHMGGWYGQRLAAG